MFALRSQNIVSHDEKCFSQKSFSNDSDNYPIYWATCHNFIGPDFFSLEMTERARQLGYSLNLPSEQIELKDVLDILN
ncbi:hypothetical protein C7H19_19400 [Aphanothece hegewaldii CCALA 016]|uniref:Uncharacterized protein n=1 Tax=Aphanothece hegewaldii CCALA 016 TaxID=2107694 RepID=A0A2T1LTB7_9CHRO|nr:hypothetical protein [Aphanothece hegewaldii]PSF33891.1 hypothetical protein C7H19_19400 [Aphanothece hegewaldii CCALA 016]